jgi:hypothetical protein
MHKGLEIVFGQGSVAFKRMTFAAQNNNFLKKDFIFI